MTALDSATGGTVRRALRRTRGDVEHAHGPAVACCAGDEMTRRRVRVVLEREGFQTSANVASVRELVERPLPATIAVVVVCCDQVLLDSPGELQMLRSELPDVRVVVVCSADGRRAVRKALAAGADGYVCEPELERALGATMWAVCVGQVCVPREMREHFQRPAFSFREKQVLQLVARGFTNGEIAQALFLAESTVKSHLSSSFRKLGVSSRKEAAAVVLDPDSGLNLEILGGAPRSHAEDLAITT